MKEDVGGFEISMQDFFVIECFESVTQLDEDFECFWLCKFAFGFDMLCQCSSIAEFIDEVIVIGSAEHFYEFDDIGVVDFGEDGDLIVGEF